MNTYQEAIEWLYQQAPMFQNIGGKAFNKSLGKSLNLDKSIGSPHRAYKTIHVAGTNGKGSVSHMLAAVLQAGGYKVGLYTSPHLKNFTERMKVNGSEADQEFVLAFLIRFKALIEEVKPSFFEITTLMAFSFFEEQEVDYAVVETGMGGRLDTTNIITPILSVITSVGLDHQQYLGDTLLQIAAEKAGIIKPGIPVICGEMPDEQVRQLIQGMANKNKSAFYYAPEYYTLEPVREERQQRWWRMSKGKGAKKDNNHFEIATQLLGLYQKHNLPIVLQALTLLVDQYDLKIKQEAIHWGLSKTCDITSFKGRWQVIQSSPLIVCDIGHNADALQIIRDQFDTMNASHLHIVWGMSADKAHHEMLAYLPKSATYYFTQAGGSRALSAGVLAKIAAEKGLKGSVFTKVTDAYEAAKSNLKANEAMFVGGSAFVVAEIPGL